jgi:hypothetical protein
VRLLATGWVACVLKTFVAFQPPEEWGHMRGIVRDILDLRDILDQGIEPARVVKAELDVMGTAAKIYDGIMYYDEKINAIRRGGFLMEDETITMILRDWFERQLPCLLSYLYVPVADIETRAKDITSRLKGTSLAKSWEAHWHYILADIGNDLAKLFSHFAFDKHPEYFQSLGLFSNMYGQWPAPENTGD